MKQCPNCKTMLEDDEMFCHECGAKQSIEEEAVQEEQPTQDGVKCVHCGEIIEEDSAFCPYCGKSQLQEEGVEEGRADAMQEQMSPEQLIKEELTSNQQEEETTAELERCEKNGNKKWLWFVLIVVVVLTLIGGGYWFYSQAPTANQPQASAETDSIEVTTDSYDIHSVDGIKARLNDIFTKALNMPDDAVVSKYFSQDFKQLYNQVEKIDATLDGPGFWNGSIWDGRQDNNPNTFEIVRISISSPTDANFDVNLIFDDGNVHSENKVSMSLLFENGNWFIDDIDMQLKESMKEYVSESETTLGNTTISGGTYSMAGKVSDYGIHMIIEIEDSTVHGDYYYDSQGSDNRVQLKGKKDENGNMKLVKYNSEGDETGYFIGIFDGSTYSGENINYKRENSLPFSVSVLRLN